MNGEHATDVAADPAATRPIVTIEPALLKPADAAKFLAFSERALWAMTAPNGPIPAIRIGRSVRYSPADLRAWVAKRSGDPCTR